MAINIFGPGASPGVNETTDRPAQVPTGKGSDTWFKDCTSEEAEDGTLHEAQFFNFLIANMRNAVRGMAIPLNAASETDDDLLLKCFQKLLVTQWLNLPIFPESLESGNVIAVQNNGGGQIEVSAGQRFLHRGWNLIDTDNYDAAARQMTTVANKTYHLRWQYNGGASIFTLKDVADGVYNPGTLAETNAAFDTTYDDMLIAKVVTNGANVPTFTVLRNAERLRDTIINSGSLSPAFINLSARTGTLNYHWGRTPVVHLEPRAWQTGPGADGGFGSNDSHDHDMHLRTTDVSRYSSSIYMMRDYAGNMSVTAHLVA